jgi:hypothetical protein
MGRVLLGGLVGGWLGFVLALPAAGQEFAAGSAAAQAPTAGSVDEALDLDIAQRRITAEEFRGSVAVELGQPGTRGLFVRAGAEVVAHDVDLTMRNVQGLVRLRANLGPLLERIGARRSGASAPSALDAPPP